MKAPTETRTEVLSFAKFYINVFLLSIDGYLLARIRYRQTEENRAFRIYYVAITIWLKDEIRQLPILAIRRTDFYFLEFWFLQ